MTDWYCSSVAYTAVTAWAATHAYSVGDIVRQLATPTVGNERCWRCSTAGTSLGSEPAWTLTKASTTTEAAGPVWTECTGNSAQQQHGGVTNTWTAPHKLIENMLAWMASGDRGFCSSDHTQTHPTSSLTFTSPGQTCQFISVNRTTGNIPPLAADITNGATSIWTSAAFGNFIINGGGLWQGFTFQAGSGADTNMAFLVANSSAFAYRFINCGFTIGSSGTIGMSFGNTGSLSKITLDNPTFTFGGALQSVQFNGGRTRINGGSVGGATFPTNMLKVGGTSVADIYGFDFSAIGSGGHTIILSTSANTAHLKLVDCKFNASATLLAAMADSTDGFKIDIINCDSGATGYRNEWHRSSGDITTETTTIHTGGATDGVQAVSHKFVSNANAMLYKPLEGPEIAIWNTATGSSKTATIEIAGGAALNNDDIWMELTYLGASGSPLATVADNSIATPLTTHAAQTSSAASWGGSPSSKQKLQVTFTPQKVGLVIARVKLAAASTTVYVDPLITIS